MTALAWFRFVGLHLAAACVFSFLHIVGMVAIRTIGYDLAGSIYHFDYQGDLLVPSVYEWRKDVLTYASNAVCYWAWGVWLAQQAALALLAAPWPTVAEPRIEIRDGARVTLVDPAQIAWIEAAGNYVEIHIGSATHLARGTLQLLPRSWLGATLFASIAPGSSTAHASGSSSRRRPAILRSRWTMAA